MFLGGYVDKDTLQKYYIFALIILGSLLLLIFQNCAEGVSVNSSTIIVDGMNEKSVFLQSTSCTRDGVTIGVGESFGFYSVQKSPKCSAYLGLQTCTTSGWKEPNSTYKYASCSSTVSGLTNIVICSLSGIQAKLNEEVNLCKKKSIGYEESCDCRKFTCTQGGFVDSFDKTIKSSYVFGSCVVADKVQCPNPSDDPNKSPKEYPYDSVVVFAKNHTVSYGTTCQVRIRRCLSDGTWSYTDAEDKFFIYPDPNERLSSNGGCKVAAPSSCSLSLKNANGAALQVVLENTSTFLDLEGLSIYKQAVVRDASECLTTGVRRKIYCKNGSLVQKNSQNQIVIFGQSDLLSYPYKSCVASEDACVPGASLEQFKVPTSENCLATGNLSVRKTLICPSSGQKPSPQEWGEYSYSSCINRTFAPVSHLWSPNALSTNKGIIFSSSPAILQIWACLPNQIQSLKVGLEIGANSNSFISVPNSEKLAAMSLAEIMTSQQVISSQIGTICGNGVQNIGAKWELSFSQLNELKGKMNGVNLFQAIYRAVILTSDGTQVLGYSDPAGPFLFPNP